MEQPPGWIFKSNCDTFIGTAENEPSTKQTRSGISFKKSIDVAADIIDRDNRGNVGVLLVNSSNDAFDIKQGDRIAQIVIEKISLPEVEEVSSLDETSRGAGGFGSTGTSGLIKQGMDLQK